MRSRRQGNSIGLAMAVAALATACGGGEVRGRGDGGPTSDADDRTADAGPDSPDAGRPPTCTGVELTQPGRLDVDLQVIQVGGALTLNGRAIDAPLGGAALRFRNELDGSTALAELSAQGQYRIALTPARYEVWFVSSRAACLAGLPCNDGRLVEVELADSGALDLDVPAIRVQGAVTVNGQPIDVRGYFIRFVATAEAMSNGSAEIRADGDHYAYDIHLLPGSYDVWWAVDNDWGFWCAEGQEPSIPCNDGKLARATLSTSGALDVDVPAIRVQGATTLNRMPADLGGYFLEFRSTDPDRGDTVALVDRDKTGSSYVIWMLPGRYDVWWAIEPDLGDPCGDTRAGAIPCNQGKMVSANLTNDGALDLDVPSVRVRGQVSINGQLLDLRGRKLRFAATGSDRGDATAPLGAGGMGSAAYSIELFPGDYDIDWSMTAASRAQCAQSESELAPCNDGRVSHAAVSTSGALDIDIESIRVQGGVRLNGQDGDLGRNGILFRGTGGVRGEVRAPIAFAGSNSHYSIALLAGDYELRWSLDPARRSACAATANALPCNDGRLLETHLASSGALDVDVPSVRVQGDVTLERGPLPDASRERGRLRFQATDSAAATDSLASAGAATYSISLLPGNYAIQYEPNQLLCNRDIDSPLPCNNSWLAGCTDR